MAVVTEEKIDQLLRKRLREQGVLEHATEIDVFPTPEGVLVEVVLRDASVLEQARRVVDSVESELEGEGISLLPSIRALWEVEKVQRIEVPNPPGAPPDLVGALFRTTLRSGDRCQEVWVAVTPSAQQVLRPLTTNDEAWGDLVSAFLQHRLSVGGAGHWDPMREPRQELDENAARYLRWRPYEALKSSIDDIFAVGNLVASFVKSMAQGRRDIHDFRAALTDLPPPGYAYARGDRLVTNNYELYDMLLESEKQQLQLYYLSQVAKAEKDFPQLKDQFPMVFRRG
jgi:hypothetical protein